MGDLRPDLPLVEVGSRQEWRDWLADHHSQPTGVWAVTYKKASVPDGLDHVPASALSEECLCFGWVDSKPARIDGSRTALLCTPRRPGSGWSKVNKDRVARLEADGRMAPAGFAAVAQAQQDGSWSALDAVDALEVPDDLAAALAAVDGARTNWDAFPPSARRGILEWIGTAKRDETRRRRVEETATLAGKNERANQWPRR